MTDKTIPALMTAYRTAHGLTQAGLAEKWGVPVSTIRGWEIGKRPAQPGMMTVLLREAMALS